MRGTDKAVVVDGIRKSFGSVVALRDISFEVGRGEVIGLLGPNGAGKTTMVDILSTLTAPDRGHAMVAGHDVMSDPAGVRRSIMLTGQHVALDDMLTGNENLMMFGRLQGLKKSDARSRATELLDQFDLVHAADRCVSTYSGGMRRRIDIACGLVVRPEVAFLDEPTNGLDPRSRQSVWDLVSDFKEAGIATLLTTQYLEEADSLSDRIILIDHGTIIAEGTADELKERTGATYCEIVPRHLKDLPAMAEALSPLVPEKNRTALTLASDRIALPAPDGPHTLVQALSHLDAAQIELIDIGLRRPSLDEVFFALTEANLRPGTGERSCGHARRRGSALLIDTTAARPTASTVQQWWVLTVRAITPTLRNGELLTQVAASIMFTVGFYIPLKQIMGVFAQGMSSYAQYLMPLIALQAIAFAAVSAAFRSATDSVQGINRRFKTMPIAPLTPLASRMSASMYRCSVALAVSLVCGHVIGFRFYGGVAHTVGILPVGSADRRGAGVSRGPDRRCERESGGHHAHDDAAAADLRAVVGRGATGRTLPELDTALCSGSTDLPVRLRAKGVGRGQHGSGR